MGYSAIYLLAESIFQPQNISILKFWFNSSDETVNKYFISDFHHYTGSCQISFKDLDYDAWTSLSFVIRIYWDGK